MAQFTQELGFCVPRARARPVIVVTHSPLLLQVSHKLIVLDAGKVVVQGPPRDVLAQLTGRPRLAGE